MLRNQKEEVQALQDTLYVLGGKWKLPIINSICNGNLRFKEIQKSIPGITSRMLSKELKDMELNNLREPKTATQKYRYSMNQPIIVNLSAR